MSIGAFAIFCHGLGLTAEDLSHMLFLMRCSIRPEEMPDVYEAMEELEAEDRADEEAEESIARDEEALDAYLASLE